MSNDTEIYSLSPICFKLSTSHGKKSLLGRVIDDHQLFGGDDLPCKAKDHVVILDSDPPGRKGEYLCSLRGKNGYVPRSKLLLLGFVQPHGADGVNALEESPIYEVPPGAMPKDADDRLAHSDQSHATTPHPKTPMLSNINGLVSQPSEAEYVVFVDEAINAVKTSTPTTAPRGRSGPPDQNNGQESPAVGGSTERQLVVKEGTGGHPSPILRHKSSLRSTQNPRRHSTASMPENSRGSGASHPNHPRPVLRWADSPKIIEIPNNHSDHLDSQMTEGDYDDLNVATGDEPQSPAPSVPSEHPEIVHPSKHSTAIRALLRSFNAESLRTSNVEVVKVLLERIHWYMEDCSNRLLRFIRPRWKTTESLAVTIPSLYDACTLYHSMSQVFTTFVYVCLEKSGDCDDKTLAKKLLKHLHPLEKHRQAYGNAIFCLDSLQWQPAEIERLSETPVTDYFGDIIGSLREINIEERSIYTALISNLDLLFAAKDAKNHTPDIACKMQNLSMESESLHEKHYNADVTYSVSGSTSRSDCYPPTTLRMPQPKPPMVPISSASPPSRLHPFMEANYERRAGHLHDSPTSPMRPTHVFHKTDGAFPARHDITTVTTLTTFHPHVSRRPETTQLTSEPIISRQIVHNSSSPNRRLSLLSYEESSNSDEQPRPFNSTVSQTSSTPPVYSPASSISPRGSGDSITVFGSHSNNHELQIQIAKVESHVEVVLTAIENFLQCLDHSQPPNVFVQHSKFIVVSAQKLLTLSNHIGHSFGMSPSGHRILALTNQLCEHLKVLVSSTKEAAIRYPSPMAMQEMLAGVESVSGVAGRLRIEITHLSRI